MIQKIKTVIYDKPHTVTLHPIWSKIDSKQKLKENGIIPGDISHGVVGWKDNTKKPNVSRVQLTKFNKKTKKAFIKDEKTKSYGQSINLPNDCLFPALQEKNWINNSEYKYIDMIPLFSDLQKLRLINIKCILLNIDLTMDSVINILNFVEKLNKFRMNNNSQSNHNDRDLSIGLKLDIGVAGISSDNKTWNSMKKLFDHILKLIKLKIPIDLKIEKYHSFHKLDLQQIKESKKLFDKSYKKHFIPLFGDDKNMINLMKPNYDKRFWDAMNKHYAKYQFHKHKHCVTMEYQIQTARIKCL